MFAFFIFFAGKKIAKKELLKSLFRTGKNTMAMSLKIALAEIGGSHDECLLSQMKSLKARGAHLTLVCTQELKDRNPYFDRYIDEYFIVSFPKTARGDFNLMRKINRYFAEHNIQKVILNTAQGGHIRNLCLTSQRQTEFVGIIHTVRKFQGSFTQKIIHRKIKKYLVLSDFLLEKIVPPRGIRVESFYPLEYPQFGTVIDKPEDETWITIAGGVENRRKDLEGCREMIRRIGDRRVKFIFLGKSDDSKPEVADFKASLEKGNLLQHAVFFDHFLSPELFDAYIRQTDFLCPLIHPGTQSAEQYISNQISGAFNLAYGYRIPLLTHVHYTYIEDLQLASFFYTPDRFSDALSDGEKNREQKVREISSVGKWNPEYQLEKFAEFVLGA